MRIVIKIGTSTLAYATGRLNIRRVEELCRVMCDLKNAGNEIILISSGAIGMGVGKLGLKSRPEDIPTKQAAAAVGQCELMYTYDKLIGGYNHTVAQILLTGEDIENEKRCENFRNTVFRLLELGAFPIVNENDTVATDEIVIGDNDSRQTSARICSSFCRISTAYTPKIRTNIPMRRSFRRCPPLRPKYLLWARERGRNSVRAA